MSARAELAAAILAHRAANKARRRAVVRGDSIRVRLGIGDEQALTRGEILLVGEDHGIDVRPLVEALRAEHETLLSGLGTPHARAQGRTGRQLPPAHPIRVHLRDEVAGALSVAADLDAATLSFALPRS